MFLAGLMLMLVTVMSVYFASAIWDAGARRSIDTYFFQTNGQSDKRLGVPASASDLGDNRMRDMLIKKYVYEYFYVIPDSENVARRTMANGTLRRMSAKAVFEQWLQGPATDIQQLADVGVLRMAEVAGPIVKQEDSDFWEVPYQLTTWMVPNDINALPEITRGTMFLAITPSDGYTEMWPDIDAEAQLRGGADPATLFRFRVKQVEIE